MFKILFTGLTSLMLMNGMVFANDNTTNDGWSNSKYKNFYELDCRFHNIEHHSSLKFCYATAFYRNNNHQLDNVHLSVGCDRDTFFDRKARIQTETTLDRLSPLDDATPGLEIFPQGQLTTPGAYTSELDISMGRLSGLCYVHKL